MTSELAKIVRDEVKTNERPIISAEDKQFEQMDVDDAGSELIKSSPPHSCSFLGFILQLFIVTMCMLTVSCRYVFSDFELYIAKCLYHLQ